MTVLNLIDAILNPLKFNFMKSLEQVKSIMQGTDCDSNSGNSQDATETVNAVNILSIKIDAFCRNPMKYHRVKACCFCNNKTEQAVEIFSYWGQGPG